MELSSRDQLIKGTTTVGIVCKDGIILAADKRATSGYLIAYKKFDKIIKAALEPQRKAKKKSTR